MCCHRRKVYDDTGATDDDDLLAAKFEDLVDYFRAIYGGVTEEGIGSFMVRACRCPLHFPLPACCTAAKNGHSGSPSACKIMA